MRAPTWVNGCAVLGTTDCPASRPLPTAQGVAAQVMSGELTCKVVTFIKNRNVTESYSLHEPNTGERPATWRRPTVAGCLRLRAAFLFVCHARACRHALRIACMFLHRITAASIGREPQHDTRALRTESLFSEHVASQPQPTGARVHVLALPCVRAHTPSTDPAVAAAASDASTDASGFLVRCSAFCVCCTVPCAFSCFVYSRLARVRHFRWRRAAARWRICFTRAPPDNGR